jgi:hypothetical protein
MTVPGLLASRRYQAPFLNPVPASVPGRANPRGNRRTRTSLPRWPVVLDEDFADMGHGVTGSADSVVHRSRLTDLPSRKPPPLSTVVP